MPLNLDSIYFVATRNPFEQVNKKKNTHTENAAKVHLEYLWHVYIFNYLFIATWYHLDELQ